LYDLNLLRKEKINLYVFSDINNVELKIVVLQGTAREIKDDLKRNHNKVLKDFLSTIFLQKF